jgi:hypothetical protein
MSDSVFKSVLPKLRLWRSEVIQSFADQGKQHEGVQLKVELDQAISCLELCQEHDILPSSRLLVIPDPSTMTPSSEYRLVEDNETEDREKWIEAKVNGQFIRPLPGSLIVENPRRRTTAIA